MAAGAVSSITPGLGRLSQFDERAGEHGDTLGRIVAGIDQVDDDDRVGEDGLAGHADEHHVGHEGVVQLSEGITCVRQHTQGFGAPGHADDGSRAPETDSASEDAGELISTPSTAPLRVTTRPGRGPSESARRRATAREAVGLSAAAGGGAGREGVEVEGVDAAVAPHLFGLGGDARGGEPLPGIGATPHQPIRAAQVPRTRRR